MSAKMKTLRAASTAVLLFGGWTTSAWAADAVLPALSPALRPATSSLLPAASSLRAAGDSLLPAAGSSFGDLKEFPREDQARWRKRWAVSLAPLAVSEILDTTSSFGMRELNPLLASPDGGFGMKAASVKFGVAGALAGIEYWLVKKYPRSAKFFTIVNWTTAGATTGLAVHNYRLH